MDKKKVCVGRTPLRYGSQQCDKPAGEYSDLCKYHAKLIAPHQLINGVFYEARPDEDDE